MDSLDFPQVLNMQPNRVSGRLNLIDSVAFIEIQPGQEDQLRLLVQNFEHSLTDSTRPTLAEITAFFQGQATLKPGTAYPTFVLNSAPTPEPTPAPQDETPEELKKEVSELQAEVTELKSELKPEENTASQAQTEQNAPENKPQ